MTAHFLLDQMLGQKNIVAKGNNVTANFKVGESGFISDSFRSGHNIFYNSGALVEVMIAMATATLSNPAGRGVVMDNHPTIVGHVGALSTASTLCDGIVDPNLTGNLVAGDTFLLFRRGPMNIVASGVIGVGVGIKTDAAGKFQAVAGSDAYPVRRGRIMVAAGADLDVRRALCDFTMP